MVASKELEMALKIDAQNRERAGVEPDRLDVEAARRSLPDLGMALPPHYQEQAMEIRGIPAWRLGAPSHARGPVIVYIHGGGFVAGSIASHRALAAWLAYSAQGHALFVDYTLAPECRFPVQIDQVTTVLHATISGEACDDASAVFVAGDSAGACIAIGAMLRARASGAAQPVAAILMCGMLDIDPASSTFANANQRIRDMGRTYLGNAAVSDPLANPAIAELANLPPMLLQTGTEDGCRADVIRFHERATAAGVDATLAVWPDMFHVWHRFAPLLPEATQALAQAGEYIRAHQV